MAVVSYQEVRQPEASIDEQGNRTYTRTFQVISDSKDDGPQVVAAAVPISLYQSYSYGSDVDTYAVCKTQNAKVVSKVNDTQYLWNYTLTYDSKPLSWGTASPTSLSPPTEDGASPTPPAHQKPQDRPWQIKGSAKLSTKSLVEDFSDPPRPILNSAKMPFKGGLETEISSPTFSVTLYKKLADWTPSKAFTYHNTVNNTTFLGFPPGQLRNTRYDWQSGWEMGEFFWQLDLEFEVTADEDWDASVLDAGTHTYDSATNNWKEIKDKLTGKPVSSPLMLNGSGQLLNAATEEPVFLVFQNYEWIDWTNIV